MKKSLAIAAALLLATAAWADTPAEKQRELSAAGLTEKPVRGEGPAFSELANPKAAPVTKGIGTDTETVQYDDGTITSLPTIFGQIYGNKFNRTTSGVYSGAMTLNSFVFYFMEDSLADTGLIFQPADPLNASSITARASINVPGLANSGESFSVPALNTISQTALGTSGNFSNTFYLGAWCLNANSSFPIDNETIGLSVNTFPGAPTDGGGFQGYTATSGTGAVVFSDQSFNAIIRANITGTTVPVPVELMAFEVE